MTTISSLTISLFLVDRKLVRLQPIPSKFLQAYADRVSSAIVRLGLRSITSSVTSKRHCKWKLNKAKIFRQ